MPLPNELMNLFFNVLLLNDRSVANLTRQPNPKVENYRRENLFFKMKNIGKLVQKPSLINFKYQILAQLNFAKEFQNIF